MTLALADWSALAPCSRQPTAELSSLVREGVGSQLALQPEQTMSSEVLRPTRFRTWNGFAPPASRTSIAEACEEAACRGAMALLDLQRPDGHWCGELLAETTLESDYRSEEHTSELQSL